MLGNSYRDGPGVQRDNVEAYKWYILCAAQGHRDEIARRDQADSSRAASPLVVAKDAEVIDTSNLTVGQVVDEIVRRLQAKNFAIR